MVNCDEDLEARPRELSETLKVVAVEADRLLVAADRMSACAACAESKGCGTKALASMSRKDLLAIDRPDGLEIRAGDMVEVSMSGNSLLAGVGLAYLLPAVIFVAALSVASGLGLSDGASAGVALLALVVSFLPVVAMERRAKRSGALQVLAVHPAARAPGWRE